MLNIHPSPNAPSTVLLLAPALAGIPDSFKQVQRSPSLHADLLARVQRLRGAVYLADGAISPAQLTADGRHEQDVDADSWHVAMVQDDGDVMACARLHAHASNVRPEDLGIWRSALVRDPEWRDTVRRAVLEEMAVARRQGSQFVEVGGWAVAEAWRGTGPAIATALSTYALAWGLGGCIGLTTATVRHCSSRILRKLGGRTLALGDVELPCYFDPQYGCDMEILRFDSNGSSPRYAGHIARMAARFFVAPVVVPTAPAPAREERQFSAHSQGSGLLSSFYPVPDAIPA
jgi:predicted GNAT family N-acyltransferase